MFEASGFWSVMTYTVPVEANQARQSGAAPDRRQKRSGGSASSAGRPTPG